MEKKWFIYERGGLLVSFEIGVGKEGSLEGPMQKKSGVQ